MPAPRFWQEGPATQGVADRNLQTAAAGLAAIDYIHSNPVARGLCQMNRDWRWSSACYESNGLVLDPLLPKITPLPAKPGRSGLLAS